MCLNIIFHCLIRCNLERNLFIKFFIMPCIQQWIKEIKNSNLNLRLWVYLLRYNRVPFFYNNETCNYVIV